MADIDVTEWTRRLYDASHPEEVRSERKRRVTVTSRRNAPIGPLEIIDFARALESLDAPAGPAVTVEMTPGGTEQKPAVPVQLRIMWEVTLPPEPASPPAEEGAPDDTQPGKGDGRRSAARRRADAVPADESEPSG